jgi:hypothetical protein
MCDWAERFLKVVKPQLKAQVDKALNGVAPQLLILKNHTPLLQLAGTYPLSQLLTRLSRS